MTTPLLALHGFGVAFDDSVVLSEVNLNVFPGMNVLMGPAGGGKSTLLRTLAGLNEAQPSLRRWGEATYLGEPLSAAHRPQLVGQNARMLASTVRENLAAGMPHRHELSQVEQLEAMTSLLARLQLHDVAEQLNSEGFLLSLRDQRALSIARAVIGSPALLLVDEPTAGLQGDDALHIVALLARCADAGGVLFVTHHREHAHAAGGHVAFLDGGRVRERGETVAFLEAPRTDAGQTFVRSGRTKTPRPDAQPEELAPDIPPPPPLPAAATAPPSHVRGPRDFYWLKRGVLAGMPRPGIVRDVDDDLAAIVRLGVDVLVSLEERALVPPSHLKRHQIEGLHFPIDDMKVPSLEAMASLCSRLHTWMKQGRAVAVHCRAGLGRTGTVLVSFLIWEGRSAAEALFEGRAINPRWVQSDEQLEFLRSFERFLHRADGSGSEPPTSRP